MWGALADAGLALKFESPAYEAVRLLLPADANEILHEPSPLPSMLPVQLSVPSPTVTFPLGAVGELPVADATWKFTTTGCPTTDGSGVSDVIEAVVLALLTVTLAEAVRPVPPFADVTLPVVLFFVPGLAPVTFAEKVQEPLAAIVPPERLTKPEPAVATIVPDPHEPVSPFGVEITRPVGSVSVKATPVRSTVVFGLLSVKLSEVEAFTAMLPAPNPFEIVGGAKTVIEAVAVLPVPALVEVTWTLSLFTPAVVPFTSTLNVQFALAAIDCPIRLIVEAPATAVTVPVQVPPMFVGLATTSPAGKLSIKPTPVIVRFWLALLSIVKVRLVEPLSGIVAAPNVLTICGGLMTVMLAVDVLPLPASVEMIETLLM